MEGAFLCSVSKLEIVTDPKHINAPDAPDVVIFDFTDLLSIDNSALDIIESFQRNPRETRQNPDCGRRERAPAASDETIGL